MGELGRVRYAVVGLGNIAQVAVLPAFAHARENCELVALVSSDREKLEKLGVKYNVKYGGSYEDLELVLEAARVHAVYIALPNALHRDAALRAARAGVHVLCEKPMAVTESDCEAMMLGARDLGVKLMVAYRLHFEETNLRTLERVRAGEIGEPRFFSSVFSHQVRGGDIRTRGDLGGGALYDMGIYCVNAARALFRDEPVEVMAHQVRGTDPRSRDVDETTTAILTFPGNRVAQIIASQGAADVSEFRVVGTKGDIRLDPAYEYAGALEEEVTVEGSTRHRTTPKRDQFAPELVYFANCILHGNQPEPSAAEGLADVRVLAAIAESARTGTKVELATFPYALRRPESSQGMKKPPVRKPVTVNAPSPSK